jgi:uncharacterized protein (DUF433 family)
MEQEIDYWKIITIEVGKTGEKPCIRNMRITVYDILTWFAFGMSRQDILSDFSELTNSDLRAALRFASDRESKATIIAQGSFYLIKIFQPG